MPVDDEATTRAREVLAAVRDEWMGFRGIVSVEVARLGDDVGLRVVVERKLAPDEVDEGELIPREKQGVKVRVDEGRAPRPE